MEGTAASLVIEMVEYNSEKYRQMVQLRFDVLRAPLGLDFTDEFLAKDADNILIGAFVNDEIIGCCQLQELVDGVYQLRQMAVSNNLQSGGIGTKIVQFAEALVIEKGGRKITLHGREVAVGFYRKLGYTTVGKMFMEVGIPHWEMEKELS